MSDPYLSRPDSRPDITPPSSLLPPPSPPPLAPQMSLRAALFLLLLFVMGAAAVVYVMYARGLFEETQRIVLLADDSEGVAVGTDLTFSGFPIGRVARIELSNEGAVRLLVDVAAKDAHWLRTTSIFTLERGLVGGTKMRAFTGVLTDPPLPPGSIRTLLIGDATAEIPRVVAAAKELIQNLRALTAADSALDQTLANVNTFTEKAKGKNGALGAVLGDDKSVEKLLLALDRTNSVLAKVDSLAANANTQVFGPNGALKDAQATINSLNALLVDARNSLKKVDAVLIEAQAVGANVKNGTADLASLRAEVESSLLKVDRLINDLNGKWPFAREHELKLP